MQNARINGEDLEYNIQGSREGDNIQGSREGEPVILIHGGVRTSYVTAYFD
jgi:hypothetical protein